MFTDFISSHGTARSRKRIKAALSLAVALLTVCSTAFSALAEEQEICELSERSHTAWTAA